jgi:GPH family glycoside/pentoside/hexuronide:cation symporter
MSKIKTLKRDKVPFGQKMAFGSGHFVLNLLPGALGFFMFFLLTAFGMDPLYAGILGALPRLFDALSDPIMGFISDNTKSRWGRRRPYIFIGAILSGILFALTWQMSPENSQMYNFWYFLILSILFLAGNTMYATPLVGLGYEMTSDYNERTRIMAFSNTMGQIAWMIVPWFWVIIADPQVYESQAVGVRQLSIIVGVVCVVLGLLPAIFCKGIDSSHMENRKKITFKTLGSNLIDLGKSIKQVSKNKPFMKLCGATFLVFNGFQMVAAFSVYIIVFYMYNGNYGDAGTWPAWFSTITAVITAFIVIPIISWMSNKWGKRKAFIISTVISIFGYILKWWGFDNQLNKEFNNTGLGDSLNNGVASIFESLNPFLESLGMTWFSIDTSQGSPWLMFVPIPFIAFGLGGLFTLMMSMTADVCDLDELENGMPRKEGTFGAIYWWMVKIGQSIALFLGGLVLKLVGFISDAETQSAETMNSLRLADIIIPSITAAIAIWIMYKYSLNETRSREIKAKLIERRGEL